MSKILLFLHHSGNRRLLMEVLATRYDVAAAESDEALHGEFDLGMVDGVALDRLWERIQSRKQTEQPAFLPFLLVTARPDVGMATRHLWKSVDELIITPIEKIELLARVEVLLHTRRLSRQFYYTLVQTAPVAIFLLDPQGRVQQWNPAAERLFGWTLNEALENAPSFLGSEGWDALRSRLPQLSTAGGSLQVELRVQRKDGAWVDILVSAAPFGAGQAQPCPLLIMASDMTDRKRAEEALQAHYALLQIAGETARFGGWSVDLRNRICTWSDAVADIHEMPRGYAPTVDEGMQFCAPEWRDKIAQVFQACAQEGIPYDEDMEIITRGGRRIWVRTIGRPVYDETGKIIRVQGAFQDITERKRLEEERAALEARLRHRQKLEALGTLAGGIAHDLNNALTPVLLGLEELRMDFPSATEVLDTLQHSIEHAAGMVRQVLTFAKGAEGQRLSVQVAHLLRDIRGILQSTFPKNIQVDVHYPKDLPTVLADATQLHQVLLNLCVNARDAMPNGGVLTVEAGQLALDAPYATAAGAPDIQPGKYVVVRVKDTGVGMTPDILEHIFEPFFTTKGEKGTGLGLATAHGIIRKHGGFVRVYSEPGKGSLFEVYLPAETSAAAPPVCATTSAFRGRGQTILVVEDEPSIRMVQRAVLQRLNFCPITAVDGADGLLQVAAHRHHLHAILVDLHMPNMNGVEFVRAVRQSLPDLPIVAVSGRFDEATEAALAALNVTSLLPKPFTEAQLAAALEKLLPPAPAR